MLLIMTKQKYVMYISTTLASAFEWAPMTEGPSIVSARHPAAQPRSISYTTVHTQIKHSFTTLCL